MKTAETPHQPSTPDDLVDTISGFYLWCIPAFIAGLGVFLYSRGILPVAIAEIFYTIATGWIGVGCYINGKRCGRVHCKINGILFPLLSIIGVLGLLGIVALDWSLYWLAFFGILIVSFGVEVFWKKYV